MSAEEDGRDRRKSRVIRCWLPLLAAGVFCLTAPGCTGGTNLDTIPESITANAQVAASETPDPAALADFLAAELDRLGKSTMQAGDYQPPSGTGNTPFDLHALLIDPDGEGGTAPLGVQLTWTERLVGDYNMDGLVSASDLTPLGQFYNQTVEYLDPADTGGVTNWPSGSVLSKPTDGESNWKLARVDGNGDGLINMQDITAIGQHWQEQLAGYRFYIQHAGSTEWDPVMDPRDGSIVLEIPFGWFRPDLSEITYYDYYVNQYRLNLPVEIDAGDQLRVVPASSAGDQGAAAVVVCERDFPWWLASYMPAQNHYSWGGASPGTCFRYEEQVIGIQTNIAEIIRGDADASGTVDAYDFAAIQQFAYMQPSTCAPDILPYALRADLDGDDFVSPADLTVIGNSYGYRLDGYAFGTPDLVMNPDDPDVPFIVPRPFEFNIQNIPDVYDVVIPVAGMVDEIQLFSVMCGDEPAYSEFETIYVGAIAETSAPFESTAPVVATITTTSLEVTAGLEKQLSGQLSFSRNGTITSYEWDLDDDGTFEAEGMEQTVIPDAVRDYTYRLRVTDDAANSAEVALTISAVGLGG